MNYKLSASLIKALVPHLLALWVMVLTISSSIVIYQDWRRERLLDYVIADTNYVMFVWYQNEAIANFNCNNSDELDAEILRRGRLVEGARAARKNAEEKLERWW